MGWRLFDSSWWKEGRNLTPHRLSSGERKPKSVVTSGAGLFILHLLPSSIVTIGCIGLLRPKEDLSMGSGVMPPDDQHFRSSHVSPATGHFLSQHCVILMRVSLCISCILHERGKEEGKFSNHSHCQTGRYFLIWSWYTTMQLIGKPLFWRYCTSRAEKQRPNNGPHRVTTQQEPTPANCGNAPKRLKRLTTKLLANTRLSLFESFFSVDVLFNFILNKPTTKPNNKSVPAITLHTHTLFRTWMAVTETWVGMRSHHLPPVGWLESTP